MQEGGFTDGGESPLAIITHLRSREGGVNKATTKKTNPAKFSD